MNKNALIIFAKNPVLGKVKTRLARETGDEKALEIYKLLLGNTYRQTKEIVCDKYLFLSDSTDKNIYDSNFKQMIQSGKDLGERMSNAFVNIFEKGFEKAIIIGTDCPELNSEIIYEAFDKLNEHDIVIGPAGDGGYYLIGLNKPDKSLFENIKWSSGEVLDMTKDKIKTSGKNYFLLKELNDIDEAKDLINYNLFN